MAPPTTIALRREGSQRQARSSPTQIFTSRSWSASSQRRRFEHSSHPDAGPSASRAARNAAASSFALGPIGGRGPADHIHVGGRQAVPHRVGGIPHSSIGGFGSRHNRE